MPYVNDMNFIFNCPIYGPINIVNDFFVVFCNVILDVNYNVIPRSDTYCFPNMGEIILSPKPMI